MSNRTTTSTNSTQHRHSRGFIIDSDTRHCLEQLTRRFGSSSLGVIDGIGQMERPELEQMFLTFYFCLREGSSFVSNSAVLSSASSTRSHNQQQGGSNPQQQLQSSQRSKNSPSPLVDFGEMATSTRKEQVTSGMSPWQSQRLPNGNPMGSSQLQPNNNNSISTSTSNRTSLKNNNLTSNEPRYSFDTFRSEEGVVGSNGASMASVASPVMNRTATGDIFHGSMSLKYKPSVREYTTLTKSRDEEGNKVINDYVMIAELGKGAQGKVKLACRKDDSQELFAIKIINKSILAKAHRHDGGLDAVKREIAIMKKLRHRNIVSLHAVVDDPTANKLYMVMDYIPKGMLLKELTPREKLEFEDPDLIYHNVDERSARRYLRQLVDGLRYLHKHHIAHRDLKPANVMLGEQGRVFLADFGVSNFVGVGDEKDKTQQGTPMFWPPEMFVENSDVTGEAQDLWALGATFYAMLFGRLPFTGRNLMELSKNIKEQQLSFPSDVRVSKNAKSLLATMLNKNPQARIPLNEIRNHSFFGNHTGHHEFTEWAEPIVSTSQEDLDDAITKGNDIEPGIRFMLIRGRKLLKDFIARIRRQIAERKERELQEHIVEATDGGVEKVESGQLSASAEPKSPTLDFEPGPASGVNTHISTKTTDVALSEPKQASSMEQSDTGLPIFPVQATIIFQSTDTDQKEASTNSTGNKGNTTTMNGDNEEKQHQQPIVRVRKNSESSSVMAPPDPAAATMSALGESTDLALTGSSVENTSTTNATTPHIKVTQPRTQLGRMLVAASPNSFSSSKNLSDSTPSDLASSGKPLVNANRADADTTATTTNSGSLPGMARSTSCTSSSAIPEEISQEQYAASPLQPKMDIVSSGHNVEPIPEEIPSPLLNGAAPNPMVTSNNNSGTRDGVVRPPPPSNSGGSGGGGGAGSMTRMHSAPKRNSTSLNEMSGKQRVSSGGDVAGTTVGGKHGSVPKMASSGGTSLERTPRATRSSHLESVEGSGGDPVATTTSTASHQPPRQDESPKFHSPPSGGPQNTGYFRQQFWRGNQ